MAKIILNKNRMEDFPYRIIKALVIGTGIGKYQWSIIKKSGTDLCIYRSKIYCKDSIIDLGGKGQVFQ